MFLIILPRDFSHTHVNSMPINVNQQKVSCSDNLSKAKKKGVEVTIWYIYQGLSTYKEYNLYKFQNNNKKIPKTALSLKMFFLKFNLASRVKAIPKMLLRLLDPLLKLWLCIHSSKHKEKYFKNPFFLCCV